MKKCPVCKSIVDEEFECPICQATLTYEPSCAGSREKYAANKYFLQYMVKQSVFSLVCLLIVLLFTFLTNDFSFRLCIVAWILAIISVLISVFQRKMIKWLQWKYNEDYAHFRVVASKYATGGLAVFAAIMIAALRVDM